MPTKCSVAFCNSNYASSTRNVPVYKFPSDQEECDRWRNALPNKLEKISKYMGVCRRHWPSDGKFVKVKSSQKRPTVPPSLFPDVPKSFRGQTTSVPCRNPRKRGILMENRSAKADELFEFEVQDKISDWTTFLQKLPTSDTVSEFQLLVDIKPDRAHLRMINNIVVEVQVTIFNDFTVTAKKLSSDIAIRDLFGFSCKLDRWSQLKEILNRANNYQCSFCKEATSVLKHLPNVHGVKLPEDARSDFCVKQMELLATSENGVRYDSQTMRQALLLYLSSRSGYKQLRKNIKLPHPKTLKRRFGGLGLAGSYSDCKTTVEQYFSTLIGDQKKCAIIYDEIYIKPSQRFRSGHIIGKAEDDAQQVARTVLALMVKPLLGGVPFVARLVPLYCLSSDYLMLQVKELTTIVHEAGGEVVTLLSDNCTANRKVYQQLATSPERPWLGENPVTGGPLFLLVDPVHLLKNIRNNWITEIMQELTIKFPGEDGQCIAKWKDITSIEEQERTSLLRRTRLTYTACHPSPIERQKVSLVTCVVDDKTCAALEVDGKIETAKFMRSLVRLWKVINCKNPHDHVRLADPDRAPIRHPDDPRLLFLESMADSFGNMSGGHGKARKKSLTKETRDALVHTLHGLAELARHLLLNTNHKYVLLGMFQSDELEGEFGIYRQLSGACYHISVEQVLMSASLRKMKLYSHLTGEPLPIAHTPSCCTSETTMKELNAMDECVERACKLQESEKASLYYVCGYIAHKEHLSRAEDDEELLALVHGAVASEFTERLSRGKLQHPPSWLFSFSCTAYAFFSIVTPTCSTRTTRHLAHIFDSLFFSHGAQHNIIRRLVNCFFKGAVRRSTDEQSLQPTLSLSERKRRKVD